MSLGYNTLPTSGSISITQLNNYFGASSTSTRMISGTGSAPNFSVNQIFNSAPGTTTPLNSNFQMISLRYYKTFGIYTNSSRNALVSDSSVIPGPFWVGYFGFGGTSSGTSGILNPRNQGFPIKIRLNMVAGTALDLYVEYTEDQNAFRWTQLSMRSNDETFVLNAVGLRISSSPFFGSVIVDVTASPCLNGVSTGTGSHTTRLTFRAEEQSSNDSSGGIRDFR
jgi:hypothetical protein